MQSLKAMARHWPESQQQIYQDAIDRLGQHGIDTGEALIRTSLTGLFNATSLSPQLLRALQCQVLLSSSWLSRPSSQETFSFSSGYAEIDRMIGGGFQSGQVVEVCSTEPIRIAQFATQAMVSFLSTFPQDDVHHVDTTGVFDAQSLDRRIDQSDDLSRILCVSAFCVADVVRALERIGALVATSPRALVVVQDIASFITGDWDSMSQVVAVTRLLRTACRLGATVLVLRVSTQPEIRGAAPSDRHRGLDALDAWTAAMDTQLVLGHSLPCPITITKARLVKTPQSCTIATLS